MIEPLFLDTSYLIALLNTGHQWHATALSWRDAIVQTRTPLLTTEYVLVEFADGLSVLRFRQQAEATISILRSSSHVEIIAASADLFETGLTLYRDRHDKAWSLTDCISFLIMRRRIMTLALTSDHHFEQAGFRALLKEPVG